MQADHEAGGGHRQSVDELLTAYRIEATEARADWKAESDCLLGKPKGNIR
jgi:hypothetical protein